MDKRKTGYSNKAFQGSSDELILAHHRIPNIQSKVVDTVAYSIRRPALTIRGGSKRYGSTLVLHNLNMFAKEGTIYCLVGASNTGKSTILSCITGQRRLTNGELLVFGAVPGSSPSGIPGRRVGFMPQELALHTELTITEVLQYHGRMYGLSIAQIKERSEQLANLLDLQNCNIRLEKLSPGLQRRSSLACALIHEPELIVLDQPTTGMDILFQKGIWSHLQKLVSNGRTSVILSTQNIEEARQAHRVGVVRSGRLLVEDSPVALLQRHGTNLLAEAIAKLSVKDAIRIKKETKPDKKGKGGAEIVCMDEWTTFGIPSGACIEDTLNEPASSVSYQEWLDQVVHGDEDQIKLKKTKQSIIKTEKNSLVSYPNPSRVANRLKALFFKQFLLTIRNVWFVLFTLLIPALLISAFCYTIGPDPHNLKFGLINEDGPKYDECMVLPGCLNEQLSCRYLEALPPKLINFKEYEIEEDALEDLEQGNIWGFLHFSPTFSGEYYNRVVSGIGSTSSNSNDSSIKLVLDSSNVYINQILRTSFKNKFENFEDELALDCNSDPMDRNITLFFETVTPGTEGSSFAEFMIPSISFGIAYFVTLFTSGLFYLRERKDGLINRSMVAAVNSAEVIFTHFIYQFPILLAQIAILITIPMFLFNFSINGFWLWAAILIGLGGFSGMSLSFLLATIFNDVKYILATGIGCLLTSLFVSGMIWPVESQHWILQWVSYVLPCSLPSESMRSIVTRGWEIEHPKVWLGFAVISGWTLAYWFVIVLVLSIRYFRR